MKAEQIILSRLLPKTGQVTSYRTGDDGEHQAGWWKGLFLSFNRTRFIAKTINGDAVVLDRATGLMWPASASAAGCSNGAWLNWNEAIDYANGLDFAGFTDWRSPNIKELFSLIDFGKEDPAINPNFFTAHSYYYWPSTTTTFDSSKAWTITFETGVVDFVAKTGNCYLRCVRGGL